LVLEGCSHLLEDLRKIELLRVLNLENSDSASVAHKVGVSPPGVHCDIAVGMVLLLQELVHFLDFMEIESLLLLPDAESSLHLLLSSFVQKVPNDLNRVCLILVSVEFGLLVLLPSVESFSLEPVAVNHDRDIFVLVPQRKGF
jgi:hypothetical protein